MTVGFRPPYSFSVKEALQFFSVALATSGTRSFPRKANRGAPRLRTDASVDGFGAELVLHDSQGTAVRRLGLQGTWPQRLASH